MNGDDEGEFKAAGFIGPKQGWTFV